MPIPLGCIGKGDTALSTPQAQTPSSRFHRWGERCSSSFVFRSWETRVRFGRGEPSLRRPSPSIVPWPGSSGHYGVLPPPGSLKGVHPCSSQEDTVSLVSPEC
uniref:Uncharacterized protein n=1 Tax=Micrurus spixii TaxID=129469 RepID=A0A2D4MUZ5_9SAUR